MVSIGMFLPLFEIVSQYGSGGLENSESDVEGKPKGKAEAKGKAKAKETAFVIVAVASSKQVFQ